MVIRSEAHATRPAGAALGLGPLGRADRPATAPFSRRGAEDDRELRRMLAIAFVLMLVPAALGRLTGWRWHPWPPGPDGFRSVVSEARAAAETYVPLGFMGN